MHARSFPRHKPNRGRIASWARLWLACIATLITCAEHLLPPALQRRLPLLDLPRRMLARMVARIILICALEQAAPTPRNRRPHQQRMAPAGRMCAILRAGVQRHLVNADGAFDLAKIARTCANPDSAIADMVAALEHGFTRRNPILPRAAFEALSTNAPFASPCALDSS